jgi:hypothetical protein
MQHLQNVKVPYPLQARTKYTTAAKCHIWHINTKCKHSILHKCASGKNKIF